VLVGVHRSGVVNTNPAWPNVSGRAPRLLASTGIPLAIASLGTRPKDSRQRDGIKIPGWRRVSVVSCDSQVEDPQMHKTREVDDGKVRADRLACSGLDPRRKRYV
jgi:hypothetical protein